jgi:hypothetical protein
VQWTENGELCVRTDDQFFDGIVSDGVGGAIVAWDNIPNVLAYSDDVYPASERSGAALWTANGVAVCTAGHILDDAGDGTRSGPVVRSSHGPTIEIVSPPRRCCSPAVECVGVAQWTLNGVDSVHRAGRAEVHAGTMSPPGSVGQSWRGTTNEAELRHLRAAVVNASALHSGSQTGGSVHGPGDQSFRPQSP